MTETKFPAFAKLKKRISVSFGMKAAAELLAKNAERFDGLYESIYRVCSEKKTAIAADTIKEWHTRAAYIAEGSKLDELTAYAAELTSDEKGIFRAAALLLRCISKAGIERDRFEGKKLTVNKRRAPAYTALDGHTIYLGEELNIITAAWFCGDRIAEHGMAGDI